MTSARANPALGSTIDPADVARFQKLAADWWDPWGPMRPLHKMNPVRADYVTDIIVEAFDLKGAGALQTPHPEEPAQQASRRMVRRSPFETRSSSAPQGEDRRRRRPVLSSVLAGQRILDIGCGAGLLSEELAKRGARVTGIDPAPANIAVAREHASRSGLVIDYRATAAENLPPDTEPFDAVLALEVVEHVADRALFLRTAAALVRPGGLLILSTLNRTLKSFALAIVGAEYVLRWLPRGTHNWEQFVTPEELIRDLRDAGLSIYDQTGMVYHPLFGEWRTSEHCDVNYFVAAEKAVAS